jgi:hypothetical protein
MREYVGVWMLKLVGFVIIWPMFWLIVAAAVNTLRARAGVDIRDGLSAFLKGMVFPPIAILGSLSPHARASGESHGMFTGGVVGTILGLYVLSQIL